MPSLRRRLVIGTALGMSAILSIAGLSLYWMMRSSLFFEFDKALREKALTLASMVEQDGEHIELEFTEAEMPEFQRAQRPEFFEVWRSDGEVVERSPSLLGHHLPLPRQAARDTATVALELPDGRPGRMVIVAFETRLDDDSEPAAEPVSLTLALARDVLDVQGVLARLRLVSGAVGGLAVLASLGVLAWLVRVGLRPVERLAGEIERIDEKQLSARIDPGRSPAELQAIVTRLNALLGRLDAAFAREKTLTADVAHELRTPLAGLRSHIEVALSRDRDQLSYRATLTQCLDICTRTQALIENLLALARLDAGNDAVHCESTDVSTLLKEVWSSFSRTAEDRGLDVNWNVASNLSADTDPHKLRLVLGNVFENAVQYADPRGRVRIEGRRVNGVLQIQVANTGSRVAAEDVPRVFVRFWRGEDARQGGGVHCGLGLALCERSIEHLGGCITADSRDGTFRIAIEVPAERS